MTTDELVKASAPGHFRTGGRVPRVTRLNGGYVDKKSGQAIRHVRAIHLVGCVWYDRVDRGPVDAVFRGQYYEG